MATFSLKGLRGALDRSYEERPLDTLKRRSPPLNRIALLTQPSRHDTCRRQAALPSTSPSASFTRLVDGDDLVMLLEGCESSIPLAARETQRTLQYAR